MDAGADGVQDQAIAGTHYAMTIFLKSRPVMAAFLLTGRVQHSMTPEGCGHVVKKSDTAILVVSEAATRGDCQAQARYKSERGAVVGKLNVAVYKKREYTLQVRSVTKTAPAHPLPDETELKNYLNNVFLQGIREWKDVQHLKEPLFTDGFDTDNDGCVDGGKIAEKNESDLLLELHGGMPPEWTKLVLLVPCVQRNGEPAAGFAQRNGRVAFVQGSLPEGELEYVIAHELGHSVGLDHACSPEQSLVDSYHPCQSASYQVEDRENIMHPGVVFPLPLLPRLRVWQWEQMENRLEP